MTFDDAAFLRELRFSYVRSSGPGGQNVNKVSSKAVLRWELMASCALSQEAKERFVARYPRRVSSEGVVTIACDRFRDRARNVEECTSRLRQLVEDILAPPRERKRLKVPRSVKERRLESKRSTSARKRTRRAPTHDD